MSLQIPCPDLSEGYGDQCLQRRARTEVGPAVPIEVTVIVPVLNERTGSYTAISPPWRTISVTGSRSWEVTHRPRAHGRSKDGVARYVRGLLDVLTVLFITRYGRRPGSLLRRYRGHRRRDCRIPQRSVALHQPPHPDSVSPDVGSAVGSGRRPEDLRWHPLGAHTPPKSSPAFSYRPCGGNCWIGGLIRWAYVSTAHVLGRVTDRIGLTRPVDAHRGQGSGFVRSLFAIYDLERMLRLGVSSWTLRSIDQVECQLGALRGKARVFEFGLGTSTAWLARTEAEVHSVEGDLAFADRMAEPALSSGARLLEVRPTASHHPDIPRNPRGHQDLDFSRDVATTDDVGPSFGLIVIDGARVQALQGWSEDRLAPGCVAVFGYLWRVRYAPAFSVFTRMLGLDPALPYRSRTAVGRSSSTTP